MGTYLNPGNILFQECTKSKIYVDKTGLIEYTNEWLNTENKFVCTIENEECASYWTATDQIRERRYVEVLHKYYGDLLLVAISYDKESGTKQHHCVIERIRKD